MAGLSDVTDAVVETDTQGTAETPGDDLRQSIVDDLRRHIGDGLVEHHLKPQDDLWIRVHPDSWAATGRALREMGFSYFCFLSALDWKPSPFGRGEDDPTQPPPERRTEIKQGLAGGETRFQVLARVTDTTRHVSVTLKADVADESMTIDSWHAMYAGANWHERETHEMFGIDFVGHPDLRNIYLPTEFEGFPLRKDFPLLSRIVKPWPGIVDVEPMPAEETPESGPESEAAAHPEMAAEPADVTDETVADAPAHPEFVSGKVPGADTAADATVETPAEDES